MASELTRKQAIFVREYVKSGNGTQAALAVYDTDRDNTAAAIASENLRKPNVKSSIERAMAANNIDPSRIAYRLDKALDAQRTVQTADGQVLGKEDDWSTQLRAVDISAKILRLYPSNGGEGGFPKHLHQHLHLEGENADILGFIARNKRLPTDSERLELAKPADPEPLQVVVEAEKPENSPDPDSHKGSRKANSA